MEIVRIDEPFFIIKPLCLGNYFYQAKAKVMGADQIKERLHLRIEQADEKMLQVLGELADFPELGPEEASLKDLGA